MATLAFNMVSSSVFTLNSRPAISPRSRVLPYTFNIQAAVDSAQPLPLEVEVAEVHLEVCNSLERYGDTVNCYTLQGHF